jgi:glycosyltransferase involved in cell wall biosynthesis
VNASVSISLVTCSYQQGAFIDATLRSVLDQGYPALEYIVIDGGSADASVDVIRRHADRLAYWTSESDRGQSDALIKGFSRAHGEVQGWLCSDDLLLPGSLQTVGNFFAEHPDVGAVYGNALWIDGAGNYLRPKKESGFHRLAFLFDHNYIPQPSMFWRRALYEKVGGLDRDFHLAMDSDLWERFSRETRIAHIPQYLSCMRYYPEQKTRALKPQGRIEDALIRQRSPLARGPGQALWHVLGRGQRIATKALAGGYGARVSSEITRALESYRIPPAPRA